MVMQYYMSLFVQISLHIYQMYIEISIELTYKTRRICYISILDIEIVDTIQRL